jgi:uncharacterized protein (DUF2147 family)
MLRRRRLTFAMALFVFALSARAATSDPTGLWLDEEKKAAILIEPCGDEFCGTIRWMKEPLRDGKPKLDINNPDPKLQTRPDCGLQLLGAFKQTDPGEWGDGWIYNPTDGKTYDSHMRLNDDGTLKVRGFIGISLLGKSQVWTKPTEPIPDCTKSEAGAPPAP